MGIRILALGLILLLRASLTFGQDDGSGIETKRITALYGERWETFAGNAGVLQSLGTSDLTTTEYLSKRLGKTQVEVLSSGEFSPDQSAKGLSGHSTVIQLHDLLAPDEIAKIR